jgi:RNA polymerase primary sigma factor
MIASAVAHLVRPKKAKAARGMANRGAAVPRTIAPAAATPRALPRDAAAVGSGRSELSERRRALFERGIEYIPCRQFLRADAERLASEAPEAVAIPLTHATVDANASVANSPYVARLYDTRLLTKEEEQYYFRRMNWLKFRAATERGRLDRKRASLRQIERIESWLREADSIKSIIISSNLRLVVSIAKKFVDANNSFEELVSEGNVALIRSVEKFNFALGNRFSTYATYAIQRIFFRISKRSWQHRQRFVCDDSSFGSLAEKPEWEGCSPGQVDSLKETFARFLDALEPREKEIMVARFGFDGRPPRTFRELGSEMGVCKERVRQIQSRAMEKLRSMAGEAGLEQIVGDWV